MAINIPNVASLIHNVFNFVIPHFNDIDGDQLTYTATLPGDSPLPNWINFNATTRNCIGTAPPVVGQRSILIHAMDPFGRSCNGTQIINVVDTAPSVTTTPLQPTTITAGFPFNFALDPSLFSDADNDPLTYNATLQNGQSLPFWLNFNSTDEVFTGTAPAGSVGIVQVQITATDTFGETASRNFDLNVLSGSNTTHVVPTDSNAHPVIAGGLDTAQALGIVGIAGASLAIASAAFLKRDFLWRKSMRCVYKLPTEYVVVGQESDYCHSVRKIKVVDKKII